MGPEYDPNLPTKYLQYLDANNLYGWAMSQPLPMGGFHWFEFQAEGKDLRTQINELANRSDREYLLEVDMSYPRELHDYHNDLSFMCGRMCINGVEKLVPNLYSQQEEICNSHWGFETGDGPWIDTRENT